MKVLIIISSLFISISGFAESSENKPPTSIMDQQIDMQRGTAPEAPNARDKNYQFKTAKDKLHTQGPKGKQAQEAVKDDELDLSKKQIERKQKGR